MKTRIVADSSCNLLELSDMDFISVPLSIRTDQDEFIDNNKLDVDRMVEHLLTHRGRSYTACPSLSDWESAFEGAEQICVFPITSALSGSCNGANIARAEHLASHPEKKIHIVNTLSAGPEITLAVWKLREFLIAGMEFEAACREIDKYIQKTSLVFALKSVHNFAQNGRISKLAATASGVLGIHVVGKASTEGTLELCAKIRGTAKAYAELVQRMLQMGYRGGRALIGHVMNEAGAAAIRRALLHTFPNADVSYHPMRGLCSYYAEKNGILIGFERG